MARKSGWSTKQVEYLIENVEKSTDTQIATFLNKSVDNVRKKRIRMGLKKQHGRGISKLRQ